MTKSRFNLRNVAIVASLAVVTMISGCDKNNDNDQNENGDGNNGGNASKVTVTDVINGSSKIANVKVQIYWHDANDEYQGYVIAQMPYKENGFTLDLPATIADKYLDIIAEDAPSGITISDKSVKWATDIDIEAFDKNDHYIGDFYMTNSDQSVFAMWFYVDKNVTIKGETEFREYDRRDGEYYDDEEYDNEVHIGKYNIDLKKGWNIVYVSETKSHNNSTGKDVYTSNMTTQKPSGANLSWYFFDYSDSYGVSLKSAKSPVRRNVLK